MANYSSEACQLHCCRIGQQGRLIILTRIIEINLVKINGNAIGKLDNDHFLPIKSFMAAPF